MVVVKQAVRILTKLGLPDSVANTILQFYRRNLRWIECKGAVHSEPLEALRSLLQGCPASCLFLAGQMAVWVRHVQRKEPRAALGAYVDDRTAWTETEADGASVLKNVLEASAEVDTALGAELHPDKGELFSSTAKGRWPLSALVPAVGPVHREFKLLGIRYNTTKAVRKPVESKWRKAVDVRLRRIAKATRNRHRRASVTRQLVISVFSYTGAWTSPTKAVISQWRNAVERTVLGKIVPGRSRYLAWVTALSPFLDPQYALDDRAIKHEKWLVRRQAAGLTADGRASRLNDVLERWAWARTA